MTAATEVDPINEKESQAFVVRSRDIRSGDVILEGAPSLPGDEGRSRAADYESWGLLGRIGQTVTATRLNRSLDVQVFFGKTAKVTLESGAMVAVERQVPTAAARRARKAESVLHDAQYYVERAEKSLTQFLSFQAGYPTMTDFLLHYGDDVVKVEAQLAVYRSFAAAVTAEGVDPVEAAAQWVAAEIFSVLNGRGTWSIEGVRPAISAVAREAQVDAINRFRHYVNAEAFVTLLSE
jgi:hypothetical protein